MTQDEAYARAELNDMQERYDALEREYKACKDENTAERIGDRLDKLFWRMVAVARERLPEGEL